MSAVARQYNLIGETLRTGIAGLMEGEMQSKALDIRAKQVGMQGEQAKFERTQKLEQYRMQRELFDENIKAARLAGQQADAESAKLANAEAQKKRGSTMFTLGADTPLEDKLVRDKVLPHMKKLGIELRTVKGAENFYDMSTNKIIPDGVLASNPDVGGLMVRYMDLDLVLADNKEIEEENLAMMEEELKLARASKSPKVSIMEDTIKMQKEKITQITGIQEDKLSKPIRYLNHKIATLSEFIQRSSNPEFHLPALKSLMEERNVELQMLEKKLTAAGQANKITWGEHMIYDKNNDPIGKISVMKGMNVQDSPGFLSLKAIHGEAYVGKRETVTDQRALRAKYAETQAGIGELIKAQVDGGVPGLAKKWRDLAAAAGMDVEYKPMEEATNHYLAWGMGARNTPQELEAELDRQIDEGFFGMNFDAKTPEEQERITAPYYAIIFGHEQAVQGK